MKALSIIGIIVSVISILISIVLANLKSYNGAIWMNVGLPFGILSLIISIFFLAFSTLHSSMG